MMTIKELEQLFAIAEANRENVPVLSHDHDKTIYDYNIDSYTNNNTIEIEKTSINSGLITKVKSYLENDKPMCIITSEKISNNLLFPSNLIFGKTSTNTQNITSVISMYPSGQFSNIIVYISEHPLFKDTMLVCNYKNSNMDLCDISNSLTIKITDSYGIYL